MTIALQPSRAAPAGRRARLRGRTGGVSRRRQGRAAYLFLAPVLLFFLIFLVLPFLFAIVLALSDWNGYDLTQIHFVGLRNFRAILSTQSTFLHPILTNTLIFAVGSVLLAIVGSIAVAHCITRIRLPGLWRTLYFLPVIATVVAIGNMWKSMYEAGGLINGALNAVGLHSVGFLAGPHTALPSVIVAQTWASIGAAVLITTAGMLAIPNDYYEAAELDAANSWHMFWRITVPLLRPTLMFVFITQFIAGLQSFALIIVMTKDGGPVNATNVAAFEMYQRAFKFALWGRASAMAVVLFLVILAVTLLQLWLFRRSSEEV